MLTEEDKEILRMHYLHGKDFRYIGDTLGFSESTIKKRHRKALQKLNHILWRAFFIALSRFLLYNDLDFSYNAIVNKTTDNLRRKKMKNLNKKIGEITYTVEFNFINNSPMQMVTGFETEEAAQNWAKENTTDGKVLWEKRIW